MPVSANAGASDGALKIQRIKYMLWAKDMKRGLEFYQAVFGFEVAFESEHWSELTWGDCIVALHGGSELDENRTGLSIQVEDIQLLERLVAKHGGQIVEPPQQREGEPIILAEIQDPEGNIVMVTQWVG